MEKRYGKQGVVLASINLDGPEERSKLPGFLKKRQIQARVLLGETGNPAGYETEAAGSLYLIDRKAILAGVPVEFIYGGLEDTLEKKLPGLLEGAAPDGPLLWTLFRAPSGFGEHWRRTLEVEAKAVAIGRPARGGRPEVGVIAGSDLVRYSATGELLGQAPLESGNWNFLRAVDLDVDGTLEWIVGDQWHFLVLNSAGDSYWDFAGPAPMQIAGFPDLDGDGLKEVVIRQRDTVVVRRNVPATLWQRADFGSLRSVRIGPQGEILVHSEQGLIALDARGKEGGGFRPISDRASFEGRLVRPSGETLDILAPAEPWAMDLEHDLDGDGRPEIVYVMDGVLVYSEEGDLILNLGAAGLWGGQVSLGDLDGRPGDELAMTIPNFGLVVLGSNARAQALTQ